MAWKLSIGKYQCVTVDHELHMPDDNLAYGMRNEACLLLYVQCRVCDLPVHVCVCFVTRDMQCFTIRCVECCHVLLAACIPFKLHKYIANCAWHKALQYMR